MSPGFRPARLLTAPCRVRFRYKRTVRDLQGGTATIETSERFDVEEVRASPNGIEIRLVGRSADSWAAVEETRTVAADTKVEVIPV